MRPWQNCHHFVDAIFTCIFLNESVYISISISLKFVPRGPNYSSSGLACSRPGDKPLSELMMISLLAHMCVTRHKWVKFDKIKDICSSLCKYALIALLYILQRKYFNLFYLHIRLSCSFLVDLCTLKISLFLHLICKRSPQSFCTKALFKIHHIWLRCNSMRTNELKLETYSISQEICTRFLLCCALLWLYIDWFSHIHQAYFTGTVAI